MRMKPKSTVHNPRAVLYKRFTDLEQSFRKKVLYETKDGKKWLFSKEDLAFVEYFGSTVGFQIINTYNPSNSNEIFVFSFKGNNFYYAMDYEFENGEWVSTKEQIKSISNAPILTGKSNIDGIVTIEYEIPDNCPVAQYESIDVSIGNGISFFAEINITNRFGETAIYKGQFVNDGQQESASIPFVQIEKNGQPSNTVVAKFFIVEVI